MNRSHPQAEELFNPNKLPASHDPFAGGGSIPLEAQRLGLESYASDLNPVAVLINKAMIEIPPKFSGLPPVGPVPNGETQPDMMEDWSGCKGLAEDIRRYGYWLRERAIERIGKYYPKIRVNKEMVEERPDLKKLENEDLTVVAWLWARTVKSPNPAFSHVDVPLVSNFVLCKKKGKEAYVSPVINGDNYEFKVKLGTPPTDALNGTKVGRGGNFKCLLSESPISVNEIRRQGKSGTFKQRLMAVIAEGKSGRVYLSPDEGIEMAARSASSEWKPETEINHNPRDIRTQLYGLDTYGDLFTPRQLAALNTFSDLIGEARNVAIQDARTYGVPDSDVGIAQGGMGCKAYGDAIAVGLALALGRSVNYWSSLTPWGGDFIVQTFGRQAIPMVWDYAEANPFSKSTGNWLGALDWVVKVFNFSIPATLAGIATQNDAQTQKISSNKVISTDPPYYDNICYADLSDYFYVWLRRSIRDIYPELFSTMAVPKAEELVATQYRHGSKENAEKFFLDGMTDAIQNLAENAHPAFPVSIYYAFKQSETKSEGTSSTGWVTFLEAVINAGFAIDGTWPVRAERDQGLKTGSNVLASCIVLVCRKRLSQAETITRRVFQRELRDEMPEALETMIGGQTGQTPIAPVDLAQAAIGPGMAIYSRYKSVLNQDGTRMSVHDALVLINRAITDYLSPDSGNFDSDTQFCSSWFEQYGWANGQFGLADTLARAKGTSVDGVRTAGVVESGGGDVRLLKWSEYEEDWDPTKDKRTPVWEACHQMIRRLNNQGESAAGQLLAKMPDKGESIRQLAYHLYTLCERKKWAEEARAYNELIGSWHAILAASNEIGHSDEQIGLDL